MSNAVILEPHEFDRLLNELKQTIRDEFANLRVNNPDPPMSRKQAARFLGISVDTLSRKIKSEEYPVSIMHGTGRNKHFFASELEAFLKKS